jgi:hypothetical protein
MKFLLCTALLLFFLNFNIATNAYSNRAGQHSAKGCNLICPEVSRHTNTRCSRQSLTVRISRTGLEAIQNTPTSGVPNCSIQK